ncbi:MAG: lipase family protein [Candidatus Microbacterium phytovorans]|uniref:Lipase family protein n=1 Tax=Candidatus Microbacterium phytovorans TaxID=3121374 RepID=A0AAJ5W1P5_9MICO|nr:lipase family protein [Microbacterium sp.]WEK12917.1 MAG: lipase family protein [Microbacterium sp.]
MSLSRLSRPVARLRRRLPTWARVVLDVAAIVLGAVLAIRPTTALDVLALLLGGGMVLTGILQFFDDARAESTRARWRFALVGVWLAGGAFVLVWPGLTVRVAAVLVGGALLLAGTLGVVGAFRRGRGLDERISDAAFGASGLIFGAVSLAWPDITLLVTAVAFGAWLLVLGISGLWTLLRARRDRAARGTRTPARRWGRTVVALGAVALAVTTALVTTPLREGSSVVDEFYAAPRDIPDEPGRLIRAEPFENQVPADANAWRILYTTTGVDGAVRVASGLVVAPRKGDGPWPVIDWNHGTTGFAQHCAPSLLEKPFWAGALFQLPQIIDEGWALVATDYIGLGTEGPHPYLIGPPSAYASLDAVRAAQELDEARLSANTVVWGHSQGGGAALWTGALARSYAPEIVLRGVAALAPAADPAALVSQLTDVTGGSIFGSFAFASYEAIYDDVSSRDYLRPGAVVTVRAMSERCLSDPGTIVSALAALGLSGDPEIFATPPTSGPLGRHLRENTPPPTVSAPLLIAQGSTDGIVRPSTQRSLVDRYCEAGQLLDYRLYDGFGHTQIVELKSSPLREELLAWTADRFAGEPVESGCRQTEIPSP